MTKNITLFCSLKPFNGHNAVIQHNALNNWKHLPGVTAILLGNDDGVAEAAVEYGFDHIPDILLSEYGTPLLDDIFYKAQTHAKTSLVCYINGDILLPYNFAVVASKVAGQLPSFLMTGPRWDVDVSERLNFSKNFSVLEKIRQERGVLYSPFGMDYFLFPNGMIDYMPPFRIGRPGWDNWIVAKTLRRKIPVVDATERITILHQNHDHKHVPGGTGDRWIGAPESAQNFELIQDDGLINCGHYKITDASHYLAKDSMTVLSRRSALLSAMRKNGLVIFGAAGKGRSDLAVLEKRNMQVKYFCDNDSQKWGVCFCGRRVLSPEDLLALGADTPILISSITNKTKITEQLWRLGFMNIVDINLLEDEYALLHNSMDMELVYYCK